MRYEESRWEIKNIEGMWRATHFFTLISGTWGYTHNEFDTEAEALMYILRSI